MSTDGPATLAMSDRIHARHLDFVIISTAVLHIRSSIRRVPMTATPTQVILLERLKITVTKNTMDRLTD